MRRYGSSGYNRVGAEAVARFGIIFGQQLAELSQNKNFMTESVSQTLNPKQTQGRNGRISGQKEEMGILILLSRWKVDTRISLVAPSQGATQPLPKVVLKTCIPLPRAATGYPGGDSLMDPCLQLYCQLVLKVDRTRLFKNIFIN